MSENKLSKEAQEMMDKVDEGDEHLFDQEEVIEVYKGKKMEPSTFRLPKILRDALERTATDQTGKSAIVRKAILDYLKENNPDALIEASKTSEKEETNSLRT